VKPDCDSTYLPVIAMHEYWMVPSIQRNFHYGFHDSNRNFDFLGTLHINNNVFDSVRFHKGLVSFRKILLDKSTIRTISPEEDIFRWDTLTVSFLSQGSSNTYNLPPVGSRSYKSQG
jgi:hypothetical protein